MQHALEQICRSGQGTARLRLGPLAQLRFALQEKRSGFVAERWGRGARGGDAGQLQGSLNPHRYLLLVRWKTIEDHTDGFRNSGQFPEWKRLLHHFYDPFPTVQHYVTT